MEIYGNNNVMNRANLNGAKNMQKSANQNSASVFTLGKAQDHGAFKMGMAYDTQGNSYSYTEYPSGYGTTVDQNGKEGSYMKTPSGTIFGSDGGTYNMMQTPSPKQNPNLVNKGFQNYQDYQNSRKRY